MDLRQNQPVHFQIGNSGRDFLLSEDFHAVRILLTRMPPMLRSILCAALGELPNAVIDEMDESGEMADTTVYLAAIARKIEVAKIDLVALLNTEEFRLSDFRHLLRCSPKTKILAICRDGRHGCLYKLDICQTPLDELALSSIFDALIEEETGNHA